MPKNGLLGRVAGHSIAHPWRVLGTALVVVALMGIAGKDAQSVLDPPTAHIGGSPSARATALDHSKFGRAETVVVMLSGPRREVDRYGPKAVRALGRIDSVEATSPWGRQAPPGLIRDFGRDRSALVILRVDRDLKAAGQETTPRVRATLDEVVPNSVSTKISGYAPLATALIEATVGATEKAEIFAAPFLLLILLLIFRSPVAAVLPLVGGLSVITVVTGASTLGSRLFHIDLYAVVGASIVGLALGVDYSLLVVSRFRYELAKAPSAAVAARATTMTAGRTVAVAGIIVAVGMGIALVIVPGTSLISSAFGVSLAALLSVLTAVTVLPAALVVLGPRIDLWRIGRQAPGSRLAPLVSRLIRRPGIATAIVLVPLLVVAVPAFGIETGPPEWRFLPKDNPVLRDYQAIEKTFGGGWGAPYEILVRSKRGPITKPEELSAIASFEDLLSDDPDVQQVIGPKPINTQVRRLLKAARKTQGDPGRIDRLASGLAQASKGVARLRQALLASSKQSGALGASLAGSASEAASISNSLGEAQAGIASLSEGTRQAKATSQSLGAELDRAEASARQAVSQARQAAASASHVASISSSFKQGVAQSKAAVSKLEGVPDQAQAAVQRASDALAATTIATKSDPKVKAAIEKVAEALAAVKGTHPLSGEQIQANYYGLTAAVDRAERQSHVALKSANQLASGAGALSGGLAKLSRGNRKLSAGTSETLAGAGKLDSALGEVRAGSAKLQSGASELRAGSDRLSAGLGQVGEGNQELGAGLRAGYRRSAPLDRGLKRASGQVSSFGNTISELTGEQGDGEPTPTAEADPAYDDRSGLEKAAASGYLTLAALKGTPKDEQQSANLVVNADRGGDTARLFVIPKGHPVDAKSLDGRLHETADDIGFETGATATVAGPAAELNDYRSLAGGRRIPVIIVLSIITFLFLTAVFRSLLLAAKAVILNLLVVGATFGIMTWLVEGPNPVLGGPGFMDAMAFIMVYGIVFTLSMDYEVFIINRMREGYASTGSTERAVEAGINTTAGVVTGAAAIMVVVFAAFAAFGAPNVKMMGAALAIAVILDATIVRLILLPATMRLFGRWNWWLPEGLERRLPNLEGGGRPVSAEGATQRRAQ